MSDTVILLQNINKTFKIRDKNTDTIRDKVFNFWRHNPKREIKALSNINIEIKKGEFFSIIGRNGSGKSTLLQVISGSYPPDKGGLVKVNGRLIRLSLGMGFNKELTAKENIIINGTVMGLPVRYIKEKMSEIIAFAELENFADTKVKYYSSGMKSRLMFAIAIHVKAEILLMDEFFGGVGDAKFQAKATEVFKTKILDGRTIIHVSHNMDNVLKYSDRAMLIIDGQCLAVGDPKDVVGKYNEVLKL